MKRRHSLENSFTVKQSLLVENEPDFISKQFRKSYNDGQVIYPVNSVLYSQEGISPNHSTRSGSFK